jgi:hypothetical protein
MRGGGTADATEAGDDHVVRRHPGAGDRRSVTA